MVLFSYVSHLHNIHEECHENLPSHFPGPHHERRLGAGQAGSPKVWRQRKVVLWYRAVSGLVGLSATHALAQGDRQSVCVAGSARHQAGSKGQFLLPGMSDK